MLVAPTLVRYEFTNAIYRIGRDNLVGPTTARDALRAALTAPLRLYATRALHESAFDFASRFNLPAAYDSHYLALADWLGVEFWTADKKLYNSVSAALPWVKLAGGESSP